MPFFGIGMKTDLFQSCGHCYPHAPKPEVRGGSREDQPYVQGALATWVQEGLEELSHVEGQEGRG